MIQSLPPSTLASLRAAETATKAYNGMRLTSPQPVVDVRKLSMLFKDCFANKLVKSAGIILLSADRKTR